MNIEIANRLADLRKQHGLSQEELADKLGVSRQAVSKWECGESSPDTDNLIALAKIYGMSLDELLGNRVHEHKEEAKADPEPEVVNAEILDENEHLTECADDDEPKGAFRIAQAIVNGAGGLIALIAFLLLGFFWHGPTGNLGWASGWTVFLLPIIISSILLCIEKRRIIRFAYPIFIVALYCDMGIIGGAYGVNLWHPYWFLFLTIPIFYIIAGSLDRIAKQ